jgi:4-amino-4-deoxy-L-arabinose transferase-like glycosyltransferase
MSETQDTRDAGSPENAGPEQKAEAEPSDPSSPAAAPEAQPSAQPSAPEDTDKADPSPDGAPHPDDPDAEVEAPDNEEAADCRPPPLLPVGNPLRLLRGSSALLLGVAVAFGIMAFRHQLRFGVPIGALAILVATFGALDLIGSFDDPEERVAGRTTLGALAGPLALFLGGLSAMAAFILLAVDGRLRLTTAASLPPAIAWLKSPVVAAGALIPAAFLTAVVGLYRVGERFNAWDRRADGKARPLLRRHGFWLIVAVTLLYLPVLGSHSLSDPWETHYGEVAREILARNDWISLWWAQDGWFWSKPILDFWIQALAIATFGVRYQSDRVLSAVLEGRVPFPEWAVRLPIFLLTLLTVYLLYKAVAKVFGRRAGLLGGVVLLTMPQWFLVTHQTMTDMPFVAPMAATMALFLLGVHTDPDEEVSVYELDLVVTRLRFSGYHLVMGSIIACALPQILYLFSRNLDISTLGIRAHFDAFSTGSPGNCGLPGNDICRPAAPVLRGLHPAIQGLIWLQALALIVYTNWGERRRQRLFFLAAWLFAALSTMAKGPAGLLLPVLCALGYVVVSRRYRDLLRMEIPSGSLIVLTVALPWFVAMYARHGQPFTDRLIFHDMFKRAFTHVHDTNEGDDVSFRYYLWQLGYATFPWTGLVPAGLIYWLRRREEGDPKSDASVFLVMWFIFAFGLFSLMLTKFHHYILPAVPPVAMLTGVLLDALLRRAGGDERAGLRLEGRTSPGAADGEDDGIALAAEGTYRKAPETSAPAVEATALPRAFIDTAIYALGILAGMALTVVGIARMIAAVRAPVVLKPGSGLVEYLSTLTAARAITVAGVALFGLAIFYSWRRSQATPSGLPEAAPSSAQPSDPFVESDPERSALEGSERLARASFLERFERVQLGAAGVAGAILVFLVGRDLSASFEGLPNQIRLLHLFTYNYRRPWPPSLNFTATLWAFTAVAAILTFSLLFARARRHTVAGLFALGIAFTAWGLDVYLMKTAPHWGQRETVMAYYEMSREAPGPLLAYQMNWKGENFYTGNRIPAFVSSGKKFQDYVTDERKKGITTFYFLTEHGRVGTLQNELGATKTFDKLTTAELNNKFLLARAVFE